ncbi:MAG: hypothetical protein NT007_09820 [Candidatus Kapabacteria bacterium]|nr:hypothetical protein [Candidatus Kapabacteria bacterium]
MKTLQEIAGLAKAKGACESQYNPFIAALEAGDELLARQIVLGNIEWLEEEDIGLDIKEVCKLADNIGLAYHQNGAIERRFNYKDGKLHGLCEEYYTDGAITHRFTYKNGELHGLCEGYYESGAIERRTDYKNGTKHGLCEWYYESGAIMCRTNFKNGESLEEKYFEDKK